MRPTSSRKGGVRAETAGGGQSIRGGMQAAGGGRGEAEMGGGRAEMEVGGDGAGVAEAKRVGKGEKGEEEKSGGMVGRERK